MIGKFIGAGASRFAPTAADPYRALPELGKPFDPSLRREAGIAPELLQVPLLNPNGATFRLFPIDGLQACVLMVDAPGHPLHGNRMRIPRTAALHLAHQIVAIFRGESGGNRGIILDNAGTPIPPHRGF